MEFGFESLAAWQKSRALVKEVYEIVRTFPSEERYGLSDQMRRAAISVSSNLAEGKGRVSSKDKIHFCQMAYGSLMEVMCQLILAQDLGLISEEYLNKIRIKVEEVGRLINGYRNYLREKSDVK